VGSISAQQSATPTPPGSTPPTFPQSTSASGTQSDSHAPLSPAQPAAGLSNDEAQRELTKKFQSEDDLKGVPVQAKVADDQVTLSGDLTDMHQHDLVMRIAHSYHGERKIVDHTTVNGQPVPAQEAEQPQQTPGIKTEDPR
jgi:osmotically-inducible protein OsmY